MSNIPIQNIYYMLCYAWDRLVEKDLVDVSKEDLPNIESLLARILSISVERCIKFGLEKSYLTYFEATRLPRGKIELSSSIKTGVFAIGKLDCQYEELSTDILANQIMKWATKKLSKSRSVSRELRQRLDKITYRLGEVSHIEVSERHFHKLRLHRNNRHYEFPIHICRLVYEMTMMSEQKGEYKFQDFLRNNMWKLFESFVRNFYKQEQKVFKVSTWEIGWQDAYGEENSLGILPVLKSDVYLESNDRRIIVDTKFYKETLQTNHGKETIHSGNLFQIYAYVKNYTLKNPKDTAVEGALLYPTVDSDVSGKVKIQGHTFHINTINLNKPWQEIHGKLLEFLGVSTLTVHAIDCGTSSELQKLKVG